MSRKNICKTIFFYKKSKFIEKSQKLNLLFKKFKVFKKYKINNIIKINKNLKLLDFLTPLSNKKFKKKVYNYYNLLYKRKLYKNKIFKIYFRDYNKKPYWKFRNSRLLHWSYFYNKSLNKRKYFKFNLLFLKKLHVLDKKFLFNFVFKVFIKLFIPQIYLERIRFELFNYFFLIKNYKTYSIFKLPNFYYKFFNWNLLLKKELKFKKKMKKQSYLNYLRYIKPWLQNKKNKKNNWVFKNTPFILENKSSFYFDVSTSCCLFLNSINYEISPFNRFLLNNYLVKLNCYRYQP